MREGSGTTRRYRPRCYRASAIASNLYISMLKGVEKERKMSPCRASDFVLRGERAGRGGWMGDIIVMGFTLYRERAMDFERCLPSPFD